MNRVYVMEVQIYACGAEASKYQTESAILVGKPKGWLTHLYQKYLC
ncbi:hypothetical protein VB774_23455 [Pseudanabaena galeata UHCC 0370]|uniref:Uncharacterized protein n=1 Tax=Pseudanabaena galeata UHCC 0370 TaxID=3110310 RepID=A0ABU5TQY3_9CYAN|nr:hypothetical protein [Pseudanabaena galeata UHCC 0370]